MPAPKPEKLPPIVGAAEIAELLGTTLRTVYIWRQRGELPEPDAIVTRTPIWLRSRIEAWRPPAQREHAGRRKPVAL